MSPTPADPVRVLVVDDHPIWRDAAARSLAEAGYVVTGTARDGAQALRVAAATPRDERAADMQQRGGILGNDGQWCQSTRNDYVASIQAGPPQLDTFADHFDVVELALGHRAPEELTLALVALDQPEPASGQRDRERQAGEAGAGTQVGDLRLVPKNVA